MYDYCECPEKLFGYVPEAKLSLLLNKIIQIKKGGGIRIPAIVQCFSSGWNSMVFKVPSNSDNSIAL